MTGKKPTAPRKSPSPKRTPAAQPSTRSPASQSLPQTGGVYRRDARGKLTRIDATPAPGGADKT